MRLSTGAHVDIPRPREEAFDALVTDEALSAYCKKRGPFAGIARAETDSPPAIGARRTITMTDGMVLEETITALERPSRHAYAWSDPPMPLGALIRKAEGDWTFEARGASTTHIRWRYTFTFRSRLLWPVAKPLVLGFRGWMQASLDRAGRELGARR